jgi:hypothetical protein
MSTHELKISINETLYGPAVDSKALPRLGLLSNNPITSII